MACEAFSFFSDLLVLMTWSFAARDWNRAHSDRQCFPFTEVKYFPGISNRFSFVTRNELLYDESIWKVLSDQLLVVAAQPCTWPRTPPATRGLLWAEFPRSVFSSLAVITFGIKRIPFIITEAEGKCDLSRPSRKEEKGSCFLDLIHLRCAHLVFTF